MSNKKRFKSFVDGKPYVLISDASDQMLRLATDIVNDKFKLINENVPNSSREDRAVLLSLQVICEQIIREDKLDKLAVENSELKIELEALKKQLDSHSVTNGLSEETLDILKNQHINNAQAKQQILASKEEEK